MTRKQGRHKPGPKKSPDSAHIRVLWQKKKSTYLFLQLYWANGSKSLGPVPDPLHPCALLDVVIREAKYLPERQLRYLLHANKSQRDFFENRKLE
jgi:hypothetical protein